jgi:phosphoribosylglycinamide formyltransferase-1
VIGVLVSGEGSNLQALIDEGLPIVAVASNRAEARALRRAAEAGIDTAVFALEEHESREDRDAAMAAWLEERGARWIVLAGYMHLLRPVFLDRFRGRVINVHPALLPEFPGAHPIEEALAAGVAETGATVHYVDQGVDSGPVIVQERVAVEAGDTVETLRARIQAVEHELLPRVVRELCVR